MSACQRAKPVSLSPSAVGYVELASNYHLSRAKLIILLSKFGSLSRVNRHIFKCSRSRLSKENTDSYIHISIRRNQGLDSLGSWDSHGNKTVDMVR